MAGLGSRGGGAGGPGGRHLPSSWGSSWQSTASAVLRPLERLWEKEAPAGRDHVPMHPMSLCTSCPPFPVRPRSPCIPCPCAPLPPYTPVPVHPMFLCTPVPMHPVPVPPRPRAPRPCAALPPCTSPCAPPSLCTRPHVPLSPCTPRPRAPLSSCTRALVLQQLHAPCPRAAHRWPARPSGCGSRPPAPPSTPGQWPWGWGAARGCGSVRGSVRGGVRGVWAPARAPGPSGIAAQPLQWEKRGVGAGAGATGAVEGEGGSLPPRDGARTPVAASGASPGGCRWGKSRGVGSEARTWLPPRALLGRCGSHRGLAAAPQHPQEKLHHEEQVDAPQHRQPLQHRCGPRLPWRLLVPPLGLDTGDWAQGTCTPRPVPRAPRPPGGYLRGARGGAGRPRRACPRPAPPGRPAASGRSRGSAAGRSQRPGPRAG